MLQLLHQLKKEEEDSLQQTAASSLDAVVRPFANIESDPVIQIKQPDEISPQKSTPSANDDLSGGIMKDTALNGVVRPTTLQPESKGGLKRSIDESKKEMPVSTSSKIRSDSPPLKKKKSNSEMGIEKGI
jgi:hypothetical protein